MFHLQCHQHIQFLLLPPMMHKKISISSPIIHTFALFTPCTYAVAIFLS